MSSAYLGYRIQGLRLGFYEFLVLSLSAFFLGGGGGRGRGGV